MLRFYNTLTRKKEPFKPLRGKTVRLYTCGPTVYHYAHIGNLRSYVFADTLKRVLQCCGYRVKHVINITDVGHLTSDADGGEDKMLLGAQREQKTVWQIAEFYTDAFKKHIDLLNVIKPSLWCRATDHIFQQIRLIQKLEKKGYTYTAGGNVYFDTSKYKGYGIFVGKDKQKRNTVARIEKDPNKKNLHDFVLWFTKSKFQNQDMKWESPWGIGYPGWHIECSAMSTYYLGQPFDIHTGGIDHIAVHHSNEIAQSEAASGKPLSTFWMHGEFLIIDARRMGKSEGNFITLQTLIDKGYDPLAYRFYLLQTHYRQQLNFSWQGMDAAQNGYRSLRENTREFLFYAEQAERKKGIINPLIKKVRAKIEKAFADDLSTPQALAAFFDLIAEINRRKEKLGKQDAITLHAFIERVDRVFGLALLDQKEKIPYKILQLVRERESARREKRWSDADELRVRVEQAGYQIEDTSHRSRVMKKS